MSKPSAIRGAIYAGIILVALGFVWGYFTGRGAGIAVVEKAVSAKDSELAKCQSELKTMQSILKRLVEGETK